jgi:apolipoprotein N-acyltransferase
VAIAMAAAPALATGKVRRPVLPVLGSLLCLGALMGFGAARLQGSETRLHEDVRLRIMQPNLAQDAKFRADATPEILARYLRLSDAASEMAPSGAAGVTHLIWPESPFPVILSRRPDVVQQIGDFLPPQTFLITGAAREETDGGQARSRFFNSILVIRSGGEVVDQYDKVHLVPFGEYLPFRALFDALRIRQFVHIPGGFEAGERRTLLRAPGLPTAVPLVCYEAIFSGAVVPAQLIERPSLLLNVTNDGWFGNTPGPRQHFAQARLRAIEEGLPLVRAANTGVSAIVDPFGRIVGSLPVGVEGVLDGGLPLPAEATPFSKYPSVIPAIIWFFALLAALIFRRPAAAHG